MAQDRNTTTSDAPHRPFPPLALLLAWLVPGLGHIYIGRVKRGLILAVVLAGMFWSGVAMGGILTGDHQRQPWWFAANMFTGVHGSVHWYRQDRLYHRVQLDIVEEYGRSVSRDSELMMKELAERNLYPPHTTASVAQVYSGVAGLLALMAIFDAFMLSLMGQVGEPAAKPSASPTPSQEASE